MSWKDDLTNIGLRQSIVRKLHEVLEGGGEFTFSSIKKSLERRGVKRLKSSNLRKYLDNASWIKKKRSNINDANVTYLKRA